MAEATPTIDEEITLSSDQIRTLYNNSAYFKGMCRRNDSIQSSADLHLISEVCEIWIPLKGNKTLSYFTSDQLSSAILFLASSDQRPINIPRSIPPLALYHMGLFLQSDLLIYLALSLVTPIAAPDMLKALLEIYPRLHGNTHPHVTFILQLISHYTKMSHNQIIRLANVPLGRALRDRVRGIIRQGTSISKFFCSICGCQYPNILLPCCHFTAHFHCLHERLMVCGQFTCNKCNHTYEAFYAGIMRPHDYYQVRLTPAHREPPDANFPNPYKNMFDLFIQHFPQLHEIAQHNRQQVENTVQAWLQAQPSRPPPVVGRPG